VRHLLLPAPPGELKRPVEHDDTRHVRVAPIGGDVDRGRGVIDKPNAPPLEARPALGQYADAPSAADYQRAWAHGGPRGHDYTSAGRRLLISCEPSTLE
jgi:hypothetical protein